MGNKGYTLVFWEKISYKASPWGSEAARVKWMTVRWTVRTRACPSRSETAVTERWLMRCSLHRRRLDTSVLDGCYASYTSSVSRQAAATFPHWGRLTIFCAFYCGGAVCSRLLQSKSQRPPPLAGKLFFSPCAYHPFDGWLWLLAKYLWSKAFVKISKGHYFWASPVQGEVAFSQENDGRVGSNCGVYVPPLLHRWAFLVRIADWEFLRRTCHQTERKRVVELFL